MRINKIKGREIYDCRGIPTLECQLFLEGDMSFSASVPAGISRSKYEAFEMRDTNGKMKKAIEVLEQVVAPSLIGRVPNVVEMDNDLIELDGTDNKHILGANVILAASIAIARAQAFLSQQELYELIAYLFSSETVTLPFPLFNMISGGAHANNGLNIQEYLILPMSSQSFTEAMEDGMKFFHALERKLEKKKKSILSSVEGGFAPVLKSDQEALEILSEIIETMEGSCVFKIGLDIAASQFFDEKNHKYRWNNELYSTNELINWYQELIKRYPIYSIEDPLAQDDWEGWSSLMKTIGSEVQIVGDDIFATDPVRIWHGMERLAANAAIIKPNQIGTVTQTLQSIQLCHEHGFNTIISHRAGETNDSFAADLAVGTSSGQIKAGGCTRGERLAKYNRLLTIEDQLTMLLLEQ